MIGMTTLPVGKDQYPRTLFAKNARDLQLVGESVFDSTVGKIEGLPPLHAQYFGSGLGFASTAGGVATGAHLAL